MLDRSHSHDLLTPAQTAAHFQIHQCTLHRWQDPRREPIPLIPDVKHGRTVRFRLSTVEHWLRSAPPRGSGQPGHPRPNRRGGRPRNIDRAVPDLRNPASVEVGGRDAAE